MFEVAREYAAGEVALRDAGFASEKLIVQETETKRQTKVLCKERRVASTLLSCISTRTAMTQAGRLLQSNSDVSRLYGGLNACWCFGRLESTP